MTLRQYSTLDLFLSSCNDSLQTWYGKPQGTGRPTPKPRSDVPSFDLTPKQQAYSASCMRVNHVGEVCAQALYRGQAITARRTDIKEKLQQASEEENDHLRWCAERLDELNAHKSYLNPLWYAGALTMGVAAGLAGDAWNLGFLAETEQQVVDHLATHLEKLPEQDTISRVIVAQMKADESEHATLAIDAGGKALPYPIRVMMKLSAKVMTSIAHYV